MMKLERAIEILAIYCRQETSPLADDFVEATKLGIEALKRLKKTRDLDNIIDITPLPGETED